ncbi:hypothetical protein Agub_g12851, partial [Astrephomene gubernaculifera]
MESLYHTAPAGRLAVGWSPSESHVRARRPASTPFLATTPNFRHVVATSPGSHASAPRLNTSVHSIPSHFQSTSSAAPLPQPSAGNPRAGTCVQVPPPSFLDVGPSSAAFWRLLTATLVPPPHRPRMATLLACLESVYR